MRTVEPKLVPGKVYRTRDLARWAKNPTALAERLVAEGSLRRLGHGLYHHPRTSSLGELPPEREELLRAFLGGRRFVFSGPAFWNSLELGGTVMFAQPLVYNTVRSGPVEVGGRSFMFRRVRFPKEPTKEWYAVDFLNNVESTDADVNEVLARIKEKLARGELNKARFAAAAASFSNKTIRKRLRDAGLLPERDRR